MKRDSEAEILLMKHFKELGFTYNREFRFHPQRKWRFDFAFETDTITVGTLAGMGTYKKRYAVEIEGGIWTNGAHVRGKHFESDLRKYNEAAKLGWTVIRFTPNMIKRGESKAFLQELFYAGK